MTALRVTRNEADELLTERFEAGTAICDQAARLRDHDEYRAWKLDRRRWVSVTKAALEHVYLEAGAAAEFEGSAYPSVGIAGGHSIWQNEVNDDLYYVSRGMNTLVSLKERLRFATEPVGGEARQERTESEGPETIFIVHGRDEGRREQVARFVERVGDRQYEPVILDEEAGRGQTLIEKFEQHATSAKYAVVLLIGDDVGGLRGETDPKPRARQNVVFELGFFFGVLGRDRVAVLYEQGVEKPSDVDGLAYIPFSGDWQQRLFRELKAAGLDFSLDRL